MTAGPLTLEDLERLENAGDNVRQHSLDPASDNAIAADAIDELLAALRSVMAERGALKARVAEFSSALDRQRVATHEESQRALLAEAERDEALALLSKARERIARYDARPIVRGDVSNMAEVSLAADLTKILGTGETT